MLVLFRRKGVRAIIASPGARDIITTWSGPILPLVADDRVWVANDNDNVSTDLHESLEYFRRTVADSQLCASIGLRPEHLGMRDRHELAAASFLSAIFNLLAPGPKTKKRTTASTNLASARMAAFDWRRSDEAHRLVNLMLASKPPNVTIDQLSSFFYLEAVKSAEAILIKLDKEDRDSERNGDHEPVAVMRVRLDDVDAASFENEMSIWSWSFGRVHRRARAAVLRHFEVLRPIVSSMSVAKVVAMLTMRMHDVAADVLLSEQDATSVQEAPRDGDVGATDRRVRFSLLRTDVAMLLASTFTPVVSSSTTLIVKNVGPYSSLEFLRELLVVASSSEFVSAWRNLFASIDVGGDCVLDADALRVALADAVLFDAIANYCIVKFHDACKKGSQGKKTKGGASFVHSNGRIAGQSEKKKTAGVSEVVADTSNDAIDATDVGDVDCDDDDGVVVTRSAKRRATAAPSESPMT